MEGEHGLLFHLKCFKFMELRQGLVDAITNGGQRQCPKWGDAGTKDNACTHMTWDNCKAVYWYVWEQSADKVDVEGGESCTAEGTSRLYKHNENWKTNEKRCPMYLEYIKGIDKRWPSGAEESLEYFHKLLTLSNLKGFIEKVSLYILCILIKTWFLFMIDIAYIQIKHKLIKLVYISLYLSFSTESLNSKN